MVARKLLFSFRDAILHLFCIVFEIMCLCHHICSSTQLSWTSLVAQLVKNLPAMWETWVRSLCWRDALEKGKGYPCQYSGLENAMDCIFHGVTKSRLYIYVSFFFFAKSLQSCPTLCDPIDGSPPGPFPMSHLSPRDVTWGVTQSRSQALEGRPGVLGQGSLSVPSSLGQIC